MTLGKFKVKRCPKCLDNGSAGETVCFDCQVDLVDVEAQVRAVFHFPNGNTSVCDENGRQIPMLQAALSGKDIEWKV